MSSSTTTMLSVLVGDDGVQEILAHTDACLECQSWVREMRRKDRPVLPACMEYIRMFHRLLKEAS